MRGHTEETVKTDQKTFFMNRGFRFTLFDFHEYRLWLYAFWLWLDAFWVKQPHRRKSEKLTKQYFLRVEVLDAFWVWQEAFWVFIPGHTVEIQSVRRTVDYSIAG